jgi:peroxiredoxin
VDPPQTSKRLKDRLASELTFLSDADGRLLDELGIRHVGAHEGRDIAYPTQVLVDGDGIVRWTYETGDLRLRADPDDVFRAIETLRERGAATGGDQ